MDREVGEPLVTNADGGVPDKLGGQRPVAGGAVDVVESVDRQEEPTTTETGPRGPVELPARITRVVLTTIAVEHLPREITPQAERERQAPPVGGWIHFVVNHLITLSVFRTALSNPLRRFDRRDNCKASRQFRG